MSGIGENSDVTAEMKPLTKPEFIDRCPDWFPEFWEDLMNNYKMGKRLNEAVKEKNEKIQELEKVSVKQKLMIDQMRLEHKMLLERIIQIEAYSMRENVLISGLDDDESDNAGLLKKVINILESDLELNDVTILRCHRVPNPKHVPDGTPRNVILRLVLREDVSRILKAAKKLKDRVGKYPMYINQQYPREIMTRRRLLYPVLKQARNLGHRATLVADKLIIEGLTYTVNNIREVPFNITTLHESTNETNFAFFVQFSMMSNFNPSPFVLGNVKYSCVEMFYQSKKAIHGNNPIAETAIMMLTDHVILFFIMW